MKKADFANRRQMMLAHIAYLTGDDQENKEHSLMVFERVLGLDERPILKDEVLRDVVAELGDTPSKEKKLYKLIEAKDVEGILAHIKALPEHDGLDFDEMDYQTVQDFVNAIRYRVEALKDEDGNFKVTENLKEMKVPSFKLAKQVQELQEEMKELTGDELTKKDDELVELLVKSSGVKLKKDDDWEKKLLVLTQMSYINRAKSTPFGGF